MMRPGQPFIYGQPKQYDVSIYWIGFPKICTDRGFKKRRPAITKIMAVLFEAFIKALETLRYTVIGVRGDRL
jgi:hypothetical protein